MTDDIYDYFSGNSSREVEPIEEDDILAEILKEDASKEVEAESDVTEEPVVELEVADESITEVVSKSEDEVIVELEDVSTEETGATADDPWAMLAGDLGLAPPPVPAKPKSESKPKAESRPKPVAKPKPKPKSKPARAAEPAAKENSKTTEVAPAKNKVDDKRSTAPSFAADAQDDLKLEPQSETSEPPVIDLDSDDIFGFKVAAEKGKQEEDESVLSDLFVPRDTTEFAAPEEDVETVDNFNEDGDEFIEFEIEDLDVNASGKSEERKSRRPKRGNQKTDDSSRRPQGSRNLDESSGKENAETRGRDAQDDERPPRRRRGRRGSSESNQEAPAPRNRSRQSESSQDKPAPRSRSRHSESSKDKPAPRSRSRESIDSDYDEVASESNDRNREREDSSSRNDRGKRTSRDEAGRSSRTRKRPENSDQERPARNSRARSEDDDELDDTVDTKKRKIPTWAEAVTGMIEANIASHQKGKGSNSGRRRPPRKKRN